MKLFIHDKYPHILDKTTIVFPVGGSSKRIQHIAQGRHKSLIKLPNNKTMLDIKIEFYRKLGFCDFVLLASKENYKYFQEHLDKAVYRKKCNIKISIPQKKIGRGAVCIEEKLYSTFLPKDVWLPVNDQKAWDEFVEYLAKRK